MRHSIKRFWLVSVALSATVFGSNASSDPNFVRVSDGEFMVGDSLYHYVGTNFWAAPILASTGRGGDRELLKRELDLMQQIGIDNIRVLAGADGEEGIPSHVMPVLQTAPGCYNDTILDGLDYLIAELEKRDMKAVVYLNNSWEWSGGYGSYLEWAGEGKAPNPAIDGYSKFMDFVAKFVRNDKAKELAADHTRFMVSRTNRYTGKPYKESPAIMSWQIGNEPRAFASDDVQKGLFAQWLASQARLIKSIDPNHLVSVGSEGKHGCEGDIVLWASIHANPDIDYATMHLWPYNWQWIENGDVPGSVDKALANAVDYITPHSQISKALGKPLVVEEFGYPRDSMATAPGSPVSGRDAFYKGVFDLIAANGMIAGCNFWAWGGYAQPPHETWQPWDPYTGDPAQEAQGLNSVFSADKSTLEIIKKSIDDLKSHSAVR